MNEKEMPLKVALIDDNSQFLQELGDYIKKSPRLECVLKVTSVEEFLKKYHPIMKLDIILLDIVFLEGMDGIRGISFIHRYCSSVEIVMLTIYEDYDKIFKSLTAGAVGYLLKRDLDDIESHLIKMKSEGGSPLSAPIARRVLEYFNPKNKKEFSKGGLLTEKEQQVIQYLSDSMSYQEIADFMNISINGVRYHIRNIYKKLKVNSKAGLFRWLKDNWS